MGAIDGLISGLNTTQIISQLMQVERLPEQQLTDHKTASQTMVSSMQGLNSLFTALQTAANAFVPDSITKQSAWGSTTGTSSAPTLASVTTGPTAQPGSARFTVTSVASAAVRRLLRHRRLTHQHGRHRPVPVTKGAAGIGLSSVTPGRHAVRRRTHHHRHAGLRRRDPHRPAGPAAHGGPRFAEHARLHPQGRHGVVHDLGDVRLGQPHSRRGRRPDRPAVRGRPHRTDRRQRPPAGQHGARGFGRLPDGRLRQHGPRAGRLVDAGRRAGRPGDAGRCRTAGGHERRSGRNAHPDRRQRRHGPGHALRRPSVGHRDHELRQCRRHGHPQRRRAGHLRVRRRRQRHSGRGLEQCLPAAV